MMVFSAPSMFRFKKIRPVTLRQAVPRFAFGFGITFVILFFLLYVFGLKGRRGEPEYTRWYPTKAQAALMSGLAGMIVGIRTIFRWDDL